MGVASRDLAFLITQLDKGLRPVGIRQSISIALILFHNQMK
jgi:hypothetical protein